MEAWRDIALWWRTTTNKARCTRGGFYLSAAVSRLPSRVKDLKQTTANDKGTSLMSHVSAF